MKTIQKYSTFFCNNKTGKQLRFDLIWFTYSDSNATLLIDKLSPKKLMTFTVGLDVDLSNEWLAWPIVSIIIGRPGLD